MTADIDAKVRRSLEGTRFASSVVEKLSGGSVNYTYRARLAAPLDDGTTEVLVKHGEEYMASKPEFPLPMFRCRIEMDILRRLSGCSSFGSIETTGTDTYKFAVRTPEFLHFDEQNANQIHEYLPGIDLKHYVLQYYGPTSTTQSPEQERQCRQLGIALGRWLKGFLAWGAEQLQTERNLFAQEVKHMVNFSWLQERVGDFPEILDGVRDILEQVEAMAAAERQDESGHQLIQGDFWTGNIILPDAPIRADAVVPMFVVDWECSRLGLPSADLGQMMGEMYALWLYKSMPAGLWMMEGFVGAYGDMSLDFAFRTAIQTGAHLLCTTTMFPGWGGREKVEEVACVGRDVIVRAWNRDAAWFEQGALACLFANAR